ncbi:TlpA family protein disulfide reductase [Pedobacter kyonggii]|uniref:TlpA family protein disulfide reductase n=1 Tax=Pedobacter kyonggii TaxID=1926871 RepID=UPI0013EEFDC3|nr:TlpA disulfide reductase family protein [Pedobacter kyonggii]
MHGQDRAPGVLRIGDRIPDSVWNAVHTVSRGGVVAAESLAGYRGKLLILDFWSTWCGPCIRSLPELDSIGRRFGDRVQVVLVTKNTEAILGAFMKNSDYGRGVKLPFVLNDSLLNMRFPHKSISHQVFIDRDGVVRAITGVNGATLPHIEAILRGAPIDFPLKDDFSVRVKSEQK